jgi:hypothetical protein
LAQKRAVSREFLTAGSRVEQMVSRRVDVSAIYLAAQSAVPMAQRWAD